LIARGQFLQVRVNTLRHLQAHFVRNGA
jgi:hypothetical protein